MFVFNEQQNPQARAIQIAGRALGLSDVQLLAPSFGFHTINAIKAELAKATPLSLEDAFAKYKDLNNIQVQGMTEVSLTRTQVTALNFGYHTICAIKAELVKTTPLSLEAAFAKYKDLRNTQVQGMTELGLTRAQVTATNFGYHTIKAIQDFQKRNLTVAHSYELVKNKSYEDTNKFVEAYMQDTRKTIKPIREMQVIRVAVYTGRGFGHQRAAITLMQKLREMGFKGTFDIQCYDRIDARLMNTQTGQMYVNKEPLVSRQLKSMIPDFESAAPDSGGVKAVAGLGKVRISSLPDDYQTDFKLSPVDLAVCAAEDSISNPETKAQIFNAEAYIGLEPTDWHQGNCFVVDRDGIITTLPSAFEMRLSSIATSQLPDISSIHLSLIEKKVLSIVQDAKVNSQLVYGLYPEKHITFEGVKETGNLDQATEMERIIEANTVISKETGKPAVILLPQGIALDERFQSMLSNSNVHFVDFTKDNLDLSKYKAGDVIISYTGKIQQAFFDYLMLKGTTLPPVIEGCNSREACESAGRPFIHGSGKHDPLKQYPAVASTAKQELHINASRCLERGASEDTQHLFRYMRESLNPDQGLLEYHKERQAAFLARPDACETAFKSLGIVVEHSLTTSIQVHRKAF